MWRGRGTDTLVSADQWLARPARGRHYINTFHADYPLLRWSLDHVFHSTDFALVRMQRLAHIGSDHFPVYVVLQTGRCLIEFKKNCRKPMPMSKKHRRRFRMGLKKQSEKETGDR